MTLAGLGSGESKLETIISYILIIGVVASILLEVIGITIFYKSYGNLNISEANAMFIRGQNFFYFIYEQVQRTYLSESALLFMTLGLIILILTPYIRAITSVSYFVWKKNHKYVLITLFVMIVLTVSLALH